MADRLWLVNDGKVGPYDGDLDDYRTLILNANRTPASEKQSDSVDEKKRARQQNAHLREQLAPLKKEAETLERRLDELNGILVKLDAALAEPGLFHENLPRATKLSKERAALISAIEKTEEAWLEASDAYETAKHESEQT